MRNPAEPAPEPRLVYVRADGCGVCHAKAPLVRRLAGEYALPLEVLDLDDEQGAARAAALRTESVPTLALVQGSRVRFRLIGRMITAENVRHLMSLTHPRSS